MVGSNRDDFSAAIKKSLAFRANHRCSFKECGKATSGPGDESPESVVKIGVAAHIEAAAPGGPRYNSAQSKQERSGIENGIWLCQNHSRLIDQNSTDFSVDELLNMKSKHEARIRDDISGTKSCPENKDFIAIGLDLVFTGELIGIENCEWKFRVDKFLIGDRSTLIAFSENFDRIDQYDRFMLINEIGDGRQIAAAPKWEQSDSSIVIFVKACDGFPRISAHDIHMDMALNDEHDMNIINGCIATISGLDALPQKIKTCLSTSRGEMYYFPSFGTRFSEYFELFIDSPLLTSLIKLEVIRMASIPYSNSITQQRSTPLPSVLFVKNVERLASQQNKNFIPFRFHLEVQGVGQWHCDLPLFIHNNGYPSLGMDEIDL